MKTIRLLNLIASGGYKLTPKEKFLNIFGFRNKKTKFNYYNDLLVTAQMQSGKWVIKEYEATTVPGEFYSKIKLLNPKGVAILKPGHYTNVYVLGKFKGEFALKQIAPVEVYRDWNLDSVYDYNKDTIDRGLFGIHIHRRSGFSDLIGKNSAGCQVIKNAEDYENFIKDCSEHANLYKKFNYTLMEI